MLLTPTGALRDCAVPSPSCPLVFWPQQTTFSFDVRPHVWALPDVICSNVKSPATGPGVVRSETVDPSPSCPSPFLPQQIARPSLSIAHEWAAPAATRPASLGKVSAGTIGATGTTGGDVKTPGRVAESLGVVREVVGGGGDAARRAESAFGDTPLSLG